MQKNEKVRSVRRAKPHKSNRKNNAVQELQKNKTDNASAKLPPENKEQHNSADRIHTVQQNKPNHNDEGIMEAYKKIKCVYCGYEMASKAKKPKCYKCGRRKFNSILEFSVTKPYKLLKGGAKMAKEKETEKVEEKKEEDFEEEADEIDGLLD